MSSSCTTSRSHGSVIDFVEYSFNKIVCAVILHDQDKADVLQPCVDLQPPVTGGQHVMCRAGATYFRFRWRPCGAVSHQGCVTVLERGDPFCSGDVLLKSGGSNCEIME